MYADIMEYNVRKGTIKRLHYDGCTFGVNYRRGDRTNWRCLGKSLTKQGVRCNASVSTKSVGGNEMLRVYPTNHVCYVKTADKHETEV